MDGVAVVDVVGESGKLEEIRNRGKWAGFVLVVCATSEATSLCNVEFACASSLQACN